MKVTVNLNKDVQKMVDSMVAYYKKHMPEKISTRETIILACVMKVWNDAHKKEV